MVDIAYRPEEETGYTPAARALHWVTAAIVLFMIPAGILMANMGDGPGKDVLFHLHRSFGVVLLPLVIIRLFYRLSHRPPPLPADIPPLQQFAAHATHWMLYALLIIQPLLGWVATSAYRAPILVFWLFELPPIWAENQPLSEKLFVIHRLVGIAIGLLVAAHVGAALFHHFIRRDTVLIRMLRG
jgi:cytochrome b561